MIVGKADYFASPTIRAASLISNQPWTVIRREKPSHVGLLFAPAVYCASRTVHSFIILGYLFNAAE
jgi:hypothetical protein